MDLKKWFRDKCYYEELERLFVFLVAPGSRVMLIGQKDRRLLGRLNAKEAVVVSFNELDSAARAAAAADSSRLVAVEEDSFTLADERPFDYVLLPDVVPVLKDVQRTLTVLRGVCGRSSRIIITVHSNLWKPWLRLATFLGLRKKENDRNWFSIDDIQNMLYLAHLETVTVGARNLIPFYFPGISWFVNRFLAQMPGLRNLCLTWYVVARRLPEPGSEPLPSVSIMVPTRNERGNIEPMFTRTPRMGSWTEFVIVDGHSDDGTVEEIQRCSKKYEKEWPRVKLIHQSGKGKGGAVRQGFDECGGDILMILDSDLTMPPEDLPKYYEAIVKGKGDFINGSRLVYAQENQAMRFLNMIANYFFGHAFSWLLSQRLKDTLCGTKALWREDYLKIAANRGYFGDFDPFGDFDLLFGSAKLNLKIVDLPIRYKARTYGEIKINRWRDGWLLLRMCAIALRRFKLV